MSRSRITATITSLTLAAGLIISQPACLGKQSGPVSMDGFYFDTVCNIAVYDMDDMSEENARAAIEKAMDECDRFEHLLSRTLEGTEIYRINHAGGEFVECSGDTVEILRQGLFWCEYSDGVFDLTIGQVSDLWDFHGEEDPQIPDADTLAEAVSHTGWQNIEISGNQVRLTDPEAEIDLGGIAKGYIADRLCELLEAEGVTSALISLGGNISSVGDKNGTPFKVGLKEPFAGATDITGIAPSVDSTVVSSGVYERYFIRNGTLYHHILDPATGMPAQTDLYGVTVTSDNAHSADCDALATIALILGREKALELIEGLDGFEAYLVDSDMEISMTSGFVTV